MGVGDPASERGMRVDFYFSRDGSKKTEWNVEIPHGSFETQSGLAYSMVKPNKLAPNYAAYFMVST